MIAVLCLTIRTARKMATMTRTATRSKMMETKDTKFLLQG